MSDVIRLIINGQVVEADVNDGDMSLIEFLHERRDLTGTKLCCGIGVCRACTVCTRKELNAPMEQTLACLTPVSVLQNVHIYTVEGLAENGQPSSLQQIFFGIIRISMWILYSRFPNGDHCNA